MNIKKETFSIVVAGGLLLSFIGFASEITSKQEKFQKAFHPLRSENFFKLFIDRSRQYLNDPKIFDVEEPGYHNAMLTAFIEMVHHLEEPISLDEVIRLHDFSVNQVQKLNLLETGFEPIRGGLGIGGSYSFRSEIEPTLEAIRDWSKHHFICNPSISGCEWRLGDYLAIYDGGTIQSTSRLLANSYNLAQIQAKSLYLEALKKLSPYFKEYQARIQRSKSDDQRLVAITILLRAIEIHHIFHDGNQRTVAFLLLNKLLIQNHFSPAILDDPFIFDGFLGTNELVREIKNGMDNFKFESLHQTPGNSQIKVAPLPVELSTLADPPCF